MKKVDIKSCYGKIFIPNSIIEAKRVQTEAQRANNLVDFLYLEKRKFELDNIAFIKEHLKQLQKKEI